MATQEQIAEAMNAMQRQIAELAGQLAEERHRGASLDRVAQVLDRWTTQQAQQPVARLVDARGKGRPSNFGSGEEKSLEKSVPVWQRKMQNYIVSVFPDLREPLGWAAMTAVPITHQLVDQGFGSEADPTDQVTDLEDKMHQIFAVLMQVTESEAGSLEEVDSPMESPDWESPPESPWTCDQPWKGKFDRIAGRIGALGGAGFEVQELQGPAGAESRHTRGHLDGRLGIVGSDRSGGCLQMNSSTFETCDAMWRCWRSSSLEQVQG